MAGSFNHLVDRNGEFYVDTVENRRDCVMALEECWDLIVYFTKGDLRKINAALEVLGYPTVSANEWNKRNPKAIRKLKPSRVERRADGSLKVITTEKGNG